MATAPESSGNVPARVTSARPQLTSVIHTTSPRSAPVGSESTDDEGLIRIAAQDRVDSTPRRTPGELGLIVALFLVGLYVVYTGITSFGFAEGQGGVDAGTLPVIAGSGLSAICLVLLLRGAAAPQGESEERVRGRALRRWSAFGVLIVAVGLVNIVGFVLMTAGVTYVLMAWVERVGQVKSAVTSIAVAGAVWLIFDAFIGVPLPRAMF